MSIYSSYNSSCFQCDTPKHECGGKQLCFGKDLVNRRDQWETPILAPRCVRGGLGEAVLVLDEQCLKNQEVLLSGYHVAAERTSFVLLCFEIPTFIYLAGQGLSCGYGI